MKEAQTNFVGGCNLIKGVAEARFLALWLLLVVVIAATVSPQTDQSNDSKAIREKQVMTFIDAFNSRNTERMLEDVEEDVQWLNISETKVSAQASGRKSLQGNMERYLESCPSCQSKLEWVKHTGERVVAFEVATWRGKDGKLNTLRGLSVYEFRNSKI